MKRIIALLLAVMLFITCLVGCSVKKTDLTSDLDDVKDAGKLVVGVTVFEPMDYQDKNGDWVGFDAELAKAFAKSVGVKSEFRIIDWDNKAFEIDSYNVDVIWNGMTLSDEVKAAMDCSNAYCNNQQIVIVPKTDADKYQTVDSVKSLYFAVETGSAGQKQAEAIGAEIKEVSDQATALTEVKSGNVDAAIIDSLMAAAMVGEGTDYSELTYTVGLNDEEYGVGFRKGSDLTEKLNKFFKDYYASGDMMKLAEKYGVQASIIEQK